MSQFEAEKTATAKSPCDCGCGDCGDKAKPAAVETQPDNTRRKMLFGGVVATPAVLMLSSRQAFANECSASATASVNISRNLSTTHCKSLSPGCWRNTVNWPSPFISGLPNPTANGPSKWTTTVSATALKTWLQGQCPGKTSAQYDAMVAKYFAINATATKCSYFSFGSSSQTFMYALWTNQGGDLFHAIAAVLNAAYFGATDFGYTLAEIKAKIEAGWGTAQLSADLDILGNDRGNAGCPQDSNFNWCTALS